MKLVVISFVYDLAYNIIRCARDAGYEVYVLGRDTAKGFKYTFACDGFREFSYRPGRDSMDAAIVEISDYVREIGAVAVLPAGIVSTRLLIEIGDRLPVRTCPLPSADTFDAMNDKWAFAGLCQAAGVRVPATRLVTGHEEILQGLRDGSLTLPLVVKPVMGMGGNGVRILRNNGDLAELAVNTHRPMLVQTFIKGRDRDISILARGGKLIAYAVQFRKNGHYDFADSAQLRALVETLVAYTGYEGVAHFDAVEEAGSGEFYLIECNPRFWNSMFVLKIAGLNMVSLSLDHDRYDAEAPMTVERQVIPVGRRAVKDFLTLSWRRGLFRVLSYYLRDLLGTITVCTKLFDDNRPGPGGLDDQLMQLSHLVSAPDWGGAKVSVETPHKFNFAQIRLQEPDRASPISPGV